jgi:hypothetical protein
MLPPAYPLYAAKVAAAAKARSGIDLDQAMAQVSALPGGEGAKRAKLFDAFAPWRTPLPPRRVLVAGSGRGARLMVNALLSTRAPTPGAARARPYSVPDVPLRAHAKHTPGFFADVLLAIDKARPGLVVLHGKARTGKTVVLAKLVMVGKKDVSYFFDADFGEGQELLMLRALAMQLGLPGYPTGATPQALRQEVLYAIHDCTLIVDALDQCAPDLARALLDLAPALALRGVKMVVSVTTGSKLVPATGACVIDLGQRPLLQHKEFVQRARLVMAELDAPGVAETLAAAFDGSFRWLEQHAEALRELLRAGALITDAVVRCVDIMRPCPAAAPALDPLAPTHARRMFALAGAELVVPACTDDMPTVALQDIMDANVVVVCMYKQTCVAEGMQVDPEMAALRSLLATFAVRAAMSGNFTVVFVTLRERDYNGLVVQEPPCPAVDVAMARVAMEAGRSQVRSNGDLPLCDFHLESVVGCEPWLYSSLARGEHTQQLLKPTGVPAVLRAITDPEPALARARRLVVWACAPRPPRVLLQAALDEAVAGMKVPALVKTAMQYSVSVRIEMRRACLAIIDQFADSAFVAAACTEAIHILAGSCGLIDARQELREALGALLVAPMPPEPPWQALADVCAAIP